MRLVIDTNLLISALLVAGSLPAHLIALWREGTFDLLTAAEQLDELMRVTRYPKHFGNALRLTAGSSARSPRPSQHLNRSTFARCNGSW